MEIRTHSSSLYNTCDAVREALQGIPSSTDASLVLAHATSEHDPTAVLQAVRSRFPSATIAGGSSASAIMTQAGVTPPEGRGLGLWVLDDSRGGYGVGSRSVRTDPVAAGKGAVMDACRDANRPGELPALLWVISVPGFEERVLEGIRAELGTEVPLLGGSTADEDVTGAWWQMDGHHVHRDHVVVVAMYPCCDVLHCYHSGYDPTDHTATVTRAEGRRLYEINGRPAADVYEEWTQLPLPQEGEVLSAASLFPFGRKPASASQWVPHVLLVPSYKHADGSLSFLAEVETHSLLVLMKGNVGTLVARAGRVATNALQSSSLVPQRIHGALTVCCAGFMMMFGERMNEVSASVAGALGNAPQMGIFTFGEQSTIVQGPFTHGNLMIGVAVFAE